MFTRATLVVCFAIAARSAIAQTDYYNTDSGRPGRIEDALVLERFALELQAAPLRFETARGRYRYSLEPEIAYGIFPRTQIELGVPLGFADRGASRTAGVAGIEVSMLHALNAETTNVPQLAIGASVLAPVGGLAPDDPYASFSLLATRTTSIGRVHLNATLTAGPPEVPNADNDADLSRWVAGVAVDHTFPLIATLISGELFANRPLHPGADVEWNAGVGLRRQLSPRWALDVGLGRHFMGDDRFTYVTLGGAFAWGLRGLIPRGGR
jgi:hypothetical protein